MEIIKILAKKLGKKIGISPPAARGLLKLAIKDELGSFINYNNLKYEQYESIIENSLRERLKKLDIKNIDEIVNYLLEKKKEYQSLITMERV
jgi:hypothetical protein